MFGLKSVYFYLVAYQITLIKFFKKIYFSSKNYNKSLETLTPKQVYYSPNPFLLSFITTYKKQSFKISEIDPNVFWLEHKKNNSKEFHNFFWLTLLDRKTDHKKLKKKQTEELLEINEKLVALFARISEVFDSRTFDRIVPDIIDSKKALLEEVKESIQKQVERTRESDSTSPKNTTLYFIILLETKDLIQACMHILNLYYEEHDGRNNVE